MGLRWPSACGWPTAHLCCRNRRGPCSRIRQAHRQGTLAGRYSARAGLFASHDDRSGGRATTRLHEARRHLCRRTGNGAATLGGTLQRRQRLDHHVACPGGRLSVRGRIPGEKSALKALARQARRRGCVAQQGQAWSLGCECAAICRRRSHLRFS